jgi:uncharacterized protein YdhG (YjbR/CyaY superfamily)
MSASPSRRTPTSVDDYLSRLAPEPRRALEKLRRDIHAAAPGAEECISYKLPAFRVNGRILFWLGAATNHVAFYPGGIVQRFAADLRGYRLSKGTIRFDPAHPLPATLVRKLVRAQVAERAPRKAGRPPGRAVKRSSRKRAR